MGKSFLQVLLESRTVPAVLKTRGHRDELRCTACAHRCVVQEGEAGVCGVRFNRGGELYAPFGYIARSYIRPVETNTIYHVIPGSKALTFGMFGCDLKCPYCQNWNISQALRDERDYERPKDTSAAMMIAQAVAAGCKVICAAFNEPLIAGEWVYHIFAQAKLYGLVTALITDGNTTTESLNYIRPVTDVYRVDLKTYSQEGYRMLGGNFAAVMDGIVTARELGYWIEIVTLVVPGFNDELAGLRKIARTVAAIDSSIPWHLNAFYPRYRMNNYPRTPARLLFAAAGSALAQGLKFVYVGNLNDELRELNHTRCPQCRKILIARENYNTTASCLNGSACPNCDYKIPGVWS